MVSVVIHSNPYLKNQIETAEWLRQGFERHGITAHVTARRVGGKSERADVHVIQGPWYAYSHWIGEPNVLMLDRCFYGHSRFDISLGWLRPDGSRDFRNMGMVAPKGRLPKLKAKKAGRRVAVVFGDYGRDPEDDIQIARRDYSSVYFRPHPAENRETTLMSPEWDLSTFWAVADVAVGHSSTVLVEAELNGLHVHTTDPRHVCHGINDREQWLTDLSWANWNYKELKSGDFWEHLC